MKNQHTRLSEQELAEFFSRLFPNGFAGADVMEEVAPEGWHNSPLFRCFHPTPEQVLAEARRRKQQIQEFQIGQSDSENPAHLPDTKPTMDDVLTKWQEKPVAVSEELTEIVARCLWDVFSANNSVLAADGRVVDIGSFRSASAFLDEYASCNARCGDEDGYYLGSILIRRRADLTKVYAMIFRRLKLRAAEWCPENSDEAMDSPTPSHKAYKQVYGRCPTCRRE